MKKYIKPSIEVLKLQMEDAILNASINMKAEKEAEEDAWSQEKDWNNSIWSNNLDEE